MGTRREPIPPIGPAIDPLRLVRFARWLGVLTPDEIVGAIQRAADLPTGELWPELTPADQHEMRRQCRGMTKSRLRTWNGYGRRQPTWLEVRALITGLYIDDSMALEDQPAAAPATRPRLTVAPAPPIAAPPAPAPPPVVMPSPVPAEAAPEPAATPLAPAAGLSLRDHQIVRLCQQKRSAADIAERVGMSPHGAAKAMRRLGFGTGRTRGDPERDERVVSLHAKHFTPTEIAARVKMSRRGVRDVLDRLGIDWRSTR